MLLRGLGRLAAVVEQRRPVARGGAVTDPVLEGDDIGGGRIDRAAQAEEAAQVVRHRAAADHQHALVGQRRQRRADRPLLLRRGAGHQRQRHHRHLGARPGALHHRPDAVIEALGLDRRRLDAGAGQQPGSLQRQGRRARRVIALRVQLGRKAAEVVDRRMARAGQHHRLAGRGMRRHHQRRPRPAEGALDHRSEPVEKAGRRRILDRDHRGAVGQIEGGQRSVHGEVIAAWPPPRDVLRLCTQRSEAARALV